MKRGLGSAFARLAQHLEPHLTALRERGRTRRADALGGLAIEAGEAEGILAELAHSEPGSRPSASAALSSGLESFDRAASAFDLSTFERDVLLLALAPEVDARFCRLFGFLNDSVVAFRPTVGLAVAALGPHAEPSSLATFLPRGRLRRFGLVETEGDGPLAGLAIRIPTDFWPRLAEVPQERSSPAGTRLDELVFAPSTEASVAATLRAVRRDPRVFVAIHGADGRATLARAIARELGDIVIAAPADLEGVSRRSAVIRDATYDRAMIVADGGATDALCRLCEEAPGPIAATIAPEQLTTLVRQAGRRVLEIKIEELDDDRRSAVWSRQGAERAGLDPAQLAARFRFDPGRIASAMALAETRARSRDASNADAADVLAACRTLGSAAGSKLAHKLETAFSPEDLVVPATTRSELDLFETAAREGHRLFRTDGPGARIRGANGVVALFAGPPGTGKTMGTQIVARRLDRDLLRIDLSQVVDKYIGETEKHLDVVFREAELAGALLFFDEADALFGKRTAVKDAHDRYSNLETAYLLQRLEQHRGICVLATNLAHNLDAAFLRRMHFIIEFPAPAAIERRTIWERHLVPESLDADVDLEFLSRFELTGGDIRNAVFSGVLLGSTQSRVTMRHLVTATARELRKAGRVSQPSDFGPWRDEVLAHLQGRAQLDQR